MDDKSNYNLDKESDGERAVRVTLENLKIRFKQEKVLGNLKYDDNYKFRIADFYLPKYNLYIEYLGGWEKKDLVEQEKERKRYNEKKEVYRKNNIRCIYIYPNQLGYISKVIKDGLNNFGYELPNNFYRNSYLKILGITFITSLLYHGGVKIKLLLLPSFIWFLSELVYKLTKCPMCRKPFGKKIIHFDYDLKKVSLDFKTETKYLYSDGAIKNSFFSDKKNRIENIFEFEIGYKCRYCGLKWNASKRRFNLSKFTRPELVHIIKTKEKNPNNIKLKKRDEIKLIPSENEKLIIHEIKQEKSNLSDTLYETLFLYKKGKSNKEIAQIRGLSISTIENHLVKLVSLGEIKEDKLISIEKRTLIINEIKKGDYEGLSNLKEKLPDNIDYWEIKVVLEILNKPNKN